MTPVLTLGAVAQQFETPSFVFARYASGSASALYAVRGLGPVGGFVAMVQNAETQYRELVAGGLTQVNWGAGGAQNVLFAVAYADASESQYVQTYVAPSFTLGRLSFSSTIEWYEPLGRAGTRQLGVNPACLTVRVGDRFALGAAYTLDLTQGTPTRHRGGPVFEWTLRRGTQLHVEVLDRAVGEPVEIRTAVFTAF